MEIGGAALNSRPLTPASRNESSASIPGGGPMSFNPVDSAVATTAGRAVNQIHLAGAGDRD